MASAAEVPLIPMVVWGTASGCGPRDGRRRLTQPAHADLDRRGRADRRCRRRDPQARATHELRQRLTQPARPRAARLPGHTGRHRMSLVAPPPGRHRADPSRRRPGWTNRARRPSRRAQPDRHTTTSTTHLHPLGHVVRHALHVPRLVHRLHRAGGVGGPRQQLVLARLGDRPLCTSSGTRPTARAAAPVRRSATSCHRRRRPRPGSPGPARTTPGRSARACRAARTGCGT